MMKLIAATGLMMVLGFSAMATESEEQKSPELTFEQAKAQYLDKIVVEYVNPEEANSHLKEILGEHYFPLIHMKTFTVFWTH